MIDTKLRVWFLVEALGFWTNLPLSINISIATLGLIYPCKNSTGVDQKIEKDRLWIKFNNPTDQKIGKNNDLKCCSLNLVEYVSTLTTEGQKYRVQTWYSNHWPYPPLPNLENLKGYFFIKGISYSNLYRKQNHSQIAIPPPPTWAVPCRAHYR